MKLAFTAIKGSQGGRTQYTANVKMSEVPHLFTFMDLNLPPEERHQRRLNKGRIPGIAQYITDNQDGFVFGSIFAAFDGPATFTPSEEDENMGILEVDLGESKILIHDGQHRAAGITAALEAAPELGDANTISVIFIKYESLERSQQVFNDLNRWAVKIPPAIHVVFDQRDEQARATRAVCQQVDVFHGLVDRERSAVPKASANLFSLVALYEATGALLDPLIDAAKQTGIPILYADKETIAVETFSFIATLIPEWNEVRAGRISAADLRRDTVSTHSVIMRAIGSIAGYLRLNEPDHWKDKLSGLSKINWNKYVTKGKGKDAETIVNPEWANVVIVGGSVVSSRQARDATKEYLRRKLGLPEKLVGPVVEVIEEKEPTAKKKGPVPAVASTEALTPRKKQQKARAA